MMEHHWQESSWEAEYHSPYLVLTNPEGESALVQIREGGRNVTLNQFRSSTKSHGIMRACQVFWKLRATSV